MSMVTMVGPKSFGLLVMATMKIMVEIGSGVTRKVSSLVVAWMDVKVVMVINMAS